MAYVTINLFPETRLFGTGHDMDDPDKMELEAILLFLLWIIPLAWWVLAGLFAMFGTQH
ncbi:hypothetical protein [Qipengyuania sp. YIM B01966]|uniref:hypothetical protein n=1 Tax=Qipengyuania sp. YIM B01966 TaxID=2778646 RepID=UPI0018F3E536|nr:hypothetical protein [Qipengyuania sp. YIM B01966]